MTKTIGITGVEIPIAIVLSFSKHKQTPDLSYIWMVFKRVLGLLCVWALGSTWQHQKDLEGARKHI